MEKTESGLQENVAGLLSYLLGWVSGLIFLLLEKQNKFVRFHAMQSIIVFGAINILLIVLWVPFRYVAFWFYDFIGSVIGIAAFILWVVLMVKAYQGVTYKLPAVGDMAEKLSTAKPA